MQAAAQVDADGTTWRAGAPYLPLLPGFRALFPGLAPVPLVASVCFHAPLVRDLVSWCGVRQVARRTFLTALAERHAVVLVPGGQAELVHTWRLFRRRELVIYTRHKGARCTKSDGVMLLSSVCPGMHVAQLPQLYFL